MSRPATDPVDIHRAGAEAVLAANVAEADRTHFLAFEDTGAYRLLDGSSIRTPGTGLWNVKGYNLENYGVPPDVDVDNTPADFLAGRDAQLEKAVEVLKEEMQKKPETKTAQAAN